MTQQPYARASWPAARARAFAGLWREGADVPTVARAFELEPHQVPLVASRLRAWGHDLPRRRGGPGGPWTPERVRPVVDAIERGTDDTDLARLMGVAKRSVASTLWRLRGQGHDIPRRPVL